MDIYLLPVGGVRYELYCDVRGSDAGEVADDAEVRSGWMRRQVVRFRTMLAEAEAERDRAERGEPGERRGGVGRWVMARLAETIAEQRLLWRVRRIDSARLVHPSDVPGPDALALAMRQFETDFGKHRRWGLIDAAVTAVTGPLFFFVPGPNLISWYFAFRALGHYYALRGARRATTRVTWETLASDALADVRDALGLEPVARRSRLDAIAAVLGLPKLTHFVERVARRPS